MIIDKKVAFGFSNQSFFTCKQKTFCINLEYFEWFDHRSTISSSLDWARSTCHSLMPQTKFGQAVR